MPITSRLRIAEMRTAYRTKTGEKITNKDIALIVFKGERVAPATRWSLLSNWDSGDRLSKCEERHLERMCDVLKCSRKELTGE